MEALVVAELLGPAAVPLALVAAELFVMVVESKAPSDSPCMVGVEVALEAREKCFRSRTQS